MPKLHNTSLLGILAATLALYFVGFIWYGLLFADAWMALSGMSEAQAEARNAALGPMMFVYGLLISLAQVVGLNWLINWAGASRWRKCIEVALVVATFISFPVLLYGWLYEGHSFAGDILDLGHLAIGYALAGLVLAVFRGKDAIDENL